MWWTFFGGKVIRYCDCIVVVIAAVVVVALREKCQTTSSFIDSA
jgi:hypothetical protein